MKSIDCHYTVSCVKSWSYFLHVNRTTYLASIAPKHLVLAELCVSAFIASKWKHVCNYCRFANCILLQIKKCIKIVSFCFTYPYWGTVKCNFQTHYAIKTQTLAIKIQSLIKFETNKQFKNNLICWNSHFSFTLFFCFDAIKIAIDISKPAVQIVTLRGH